MIYWLLNCHDGKEGSVVNKGKNSTKLIATMHSITSTFLYYSLGYSLFHIILEYIVNISDY